MGHKPSESEARNNVLIEEATDGRHHIAQRVSFHELRAAFDAMNDAVSLIGLDGRILQCNEAMAKFLQKPIGEIVGGTCWELMHGTSGPIDGCPIVRMKASRGRENLELPIGNKWFNITVDPLTDPIGLIGAVHIVSDVTEQKRTEEALKKSEERFRLAMLGATDGLWDWNLQTDEVYYSPRWKSMLGYAEDELEDHLDTWKRLVHPDDEGPTLAFVQRFLELRVDKYEVEFRMRHKDGHYRNILSRAFPVYGAQGSALRLVGTHVDITERKQAEEALKGSKKKLQDITSYIGVGIYAFDMDGRITFMNNEAERLLGWTMSELNAKGPHNLVHYLKADGSPQPFEECKIHSVVRTGKQFVSTDEFFIRKDGTVFPISVITNPIFEKGRVVSSVTAFRDITERKRLEEELLKARKLEAVGVLAGGIAHDFNNLLQIIIGNIGLAKMCSNPGAEIFERLTKAEKAAAQSTELSYRLLTFSKGGEPIRRVTPVGRLLREVLSLSVSGSNITAEVDLTDDLCCVELDERQMRQVFNNLFVNAKEAMPEGGMIRVRAENVAVTERDGLPLKGGRYLKISVADNGAGIPGDNLPRIFDPYFTTKGLGSSKGTGLGLAVCHSVIKKHEGHISVESQEGAGSTFHVYLPVSEKGSRSEERDEQKSAAKAVVVLLMDDEEVVRNVAGDMLEYLGCLVKYARNGEEAVEIYERAKESGGGFDAVILDLTVQEGMGGDRAVEKLLEIDPAVKAVISSGYTDDPIMKDFRAYGFAEAIAKPYTIGQLRELFTKLLAIGHVEGGR